MLHCGASLQHRRCNIPTPADPTMLQQSTAMRHPNTSRPDDASAEHRHLGNASSQHRRMLRFNSWWRRRMLRHTGQQRQHAAAMTDAAMLCMAAMADAATQHAVSTADAATGLLDGMGSSRRSPCTYSRAHGGSRFVWKERDDERLTCSCHKKIRYWWAHPMGKTWPVLEAGDRLHRMGRDEA